MQTRREAVILMTATPLLLSDAVAQPDRLDVLFGLSVPSRVRQRYDILAYYIQLLNLQRPIRSRSEDIDAAIKTYQLVGESHCQERCKICGRSASIVRPEPTAGIFQFRGRTLGLLETVWDRPKIARC